MQIFVKYFRFLIYTNLWRILLTYPIFLYYAINMYRKFSIIFLAFFFFSLFGLYGETVSQCDFLYNQFLKDGFFPEKQPLEGTLSDEFPYNIILKEKSISEESVLFLVSIEDALEISQELEEISQFGTVICTANDKSILFPTFPAGTQTAIDEYSQKKTKPPVLYLSINTDNEKFWTITPGSNGLISPSYTFSKLKKSLEKEDIYSYVADGSLALYKINLTKSDSVVSVLLENDFPAIKLNFQTNNKEKLPNVAKHFAEDYDFYNQKNKEVNYDSVSVFSSSFIISESTLTLIFISVVTFSLFSICVLSFMFGRRKTAHKKTMLKYWYIAPLFLAITLFCFLFAQIITKWIFPVWEFFPQYGLLIKFLIACMIFALFYIMRKILKIPSRAFIYSYLLNIISFVNFFVFSALDLPFLLIFGVEYIFVYISQGFKKTFLLIIATLLLIFPFFPTLFGVFANSDFSSLTTLVNGNLFVNLILSLFILPLAFMIMRIILSVKRKHHIKRQIIKLGILGIILVSFLVCVAFFNNHLEKNNSLTKETVHFVESNEDLANFSLISDSSIGFSDNKLTIQALEDVLYYEIKIFSDSTFPIFSSNFPFSFFETENAAQFNLAENPPKDFTLEFLTEDGAAFQIEVKVFAKKTNTNTENSTNIDSEKTPTIETKLYIISNTGETTSKQFISQGKAL